MQEIKILEDLTYYLKSFKPDSANKRFREALQFAIDVLKRVEDVEGLVEELQINGDDIIGKDDIYTCCLSLEELAQAIKSYLLGKK